jgi:hypothetical protein
VTAASETAYEVAEQIYFASGALQPDEQTPPEDLEGFPALTLPVLADCSAVAVPQCVHECIQTMVFLSGLEEARALAAVAAPVQEMPRTRAIRSLAEWCCRICSAYSQSSGSSSCTTKRVLRRFATCWKCSPRQATSKR